MTERDAERIVPVGKDVGFDRDPFTDGPLDGEAAAVNRWRDLLDDDAAAAVEVWANDGPEACMNQFNA